MVATHGAHRVVLRCRSLVARKETGRTLSSGSGRKYDDGSSDNLRDADFSSLFTSSSRDSSSVKSESSSSDNSPYWRTLLKDSSSSSSTRTLLKDSSSSSSTQQWDFLHNIDTSSRTYPSPRAHNVSSFGTSFRKLGDSGIEFLREDADRPSITRAETPEEQPKSGLQNILTSASFKLLRDTFQKADSSKAMVGDFLGLDSDTIFSSEEGSSKPVDGRSLAEVEGNVYSAPDPSLTKDTKTYTYDELGKKLRWARPSMDQVLSSATGLSFGELRVRFQKIEHAENDVGEDQNAFSHLKEGLNHLVKSPKSLAAKKQLSYQELAFVNHVGTGTGVLEKIEYTPPKDELLTKYYTDGQLSSKERLKLEIKKLREEFQTHDCDSGSPQVQIAILTARINNLNRHMREGPNYKRDKHSKKGLNDMVQYRKRLLRYLRRRDWPVYCDVLTKLKLDDVILENRR